MKITINDLRLKKLSVFFPLLLSFCTFTVAASGYSFEYNSSSGNSFQDAYSPYSFPSGEYGSEGVFKPYSGYYATNNESGRISDVALFDGPGGDPIGGLPLKDSLVFLLALTLLYAAVVLYRNFLPKKTDAL